MKNVLMCILLLSSASSFAGIMLEPFAGTILSGDVKDNDNCSSDCEEELSGSTMGARVAYTVAGLQFGFDYRTGNFKFKDAGTDVKEAGALGFMVGYEFPILLRFWYVHNLSTSLSADSNGNTIDYETGSGSIIGAGYKILPFLSLNVEMQSMNVNKIKYTGGESSADLDFSNTVVSLSLPFSF